MLMIYSYFKHQIKRIKQIPQKLSLQWISRPVIDFTLSGHYERKKQQKTRILGLTQAIYIEILDN